MTTFHANLLKKFAIELIKVTRQEVRLLVSFLEDTKLNIFQSRPPPPHKSDILGRFYEVDDKYLDFFVADIWGSQMEGDL